MSNIIKALQSLHETGGFTYSFNTGELNPTTGFTLAVSKDHERIIKNVSRFKKEAIEKEVKKYTLEKSNALTDAGRFLGVWTDADTGQLFLDVSEVVETRLDAERLCKERGQLAYWDNEAGKEVRIG